MNIVETVTGKKYKIVIDRVTNSDYKSITKKRYFFNWKEEQEYEVYKLALEDTEDRLGLVSVETIPKELRIHIRLLTVSKENTGQHKIYQKIAGNLITHVSKIALRKYAEFACVSLTPKSNLTQHYIDAYGMNITGRTLSLELPEILNLIKKYDHDE